MGNSLEKRPAACISWEIDAQDAVGRRRTLAASLPGSPLLGVDICALLNGYRGRCPHAAVGRRKARLPVGSGFEPLYSGHLRSRKRLIWVVPSWWKVLSHRLLA